MAEVLITLSIIGVVAALTMPSLVSNYQKKQTVTQLKKAYSEINQAIKLSEIKYGPSETWHFTDIGNADEQNKYFSENYIFPNIRTLKVCNKENLTECWAENTYNIDGQKIVNYFSERPAFITASGYSVYYWLHGNDQGGWVWIDINGPHKKPNTLGKDIFAFQMNWKYIENNATTDARVGFLPFGLHYKISHSREDILSGENMPHGSMFSCSKNGKRLSGGYCSAIIMYDGWEIGPEYPW